MTDHRYKFYFFVLLIMLMLGFKVLKNPLPATISIDVIKQMDVVRQLEIKQPSQKVLSFTTDSINFPEHSELFHENTGKLGYKKDFFLKVTTLMHIEKKAFYQFSINSDDGFELKLDGKLICAHPQGREMSLTTCEPIELKKGAHQLLLNYYQGFGKLGLIAHYSRTDRMDYSFLVGQASPYVYFQLTTDSLSSD